MSKMDNLRAMREAKYAAAQARPKTPAAPGTPAKAPATAAAPKRAAAKPAAAPKTAPDGAPATEELCGHKNMSGRTCTREKGHSAKSHRYS